MEQTRDPHSGVLRPEHLSILKGSARRLGFGSMEAASVVFSAIFVILSELGL